MLKRHVNRGGFDTTITLRDANETYSLVRSWLGLRYAPGEWFTAPRENPKFDHTTQRYTYGMTLLPARSAYTYYTQHAMRFGKFGPVLTIQSALRHFGMCPWSTRQCRNACLAFAGRGRFDNQIVGRLARVIMWAMFPDHAYVLLVHHIRAIVRKHGAENVAVRLNVLSDVEWERILPSAFWTEFADVQFYDYTKSDGRWFLPENYHLTLSAHERWSVNDVRATIMTVGKNVAVVTDIPLNEPKPDTWFGLPAIDGTTHDARYTDPEGVVVLLSPLGKAKRLPVGEREFVKPARGA
jgi:hypothetical protein